MCPANNNDTIFVTLHRATIVIESRCPKYRSGTSSSNALRYIAGYQRCRRWVKSKEYSNRNKKNRYNYIQGGTIKCPKRQCSAIAIPVAAFRGWSPVVGVTSFSSRFAGVSFSSFFSPKQTQQQEIMLYYCRCPAPWHSVQTTSSEQMTKNIVQYYWIDCARNIFQ